MVTLDKTIQMRRSKAIYIYFHMNPDLSLAEVGEVFGLSENDARDFIQQEKDRREAPILALKRRNAAIYQYRLEHPDMSMVEIGSVFGNITKQRVSSIIQRERQKRDLLLKKEAGSPVDRTEKP
jgi:predicted DNA-binding protein YlxM (UPF0122 family)